MGQMTRGKRGLAAVTGAGVLGAGVLGCGQSSAQDDMTLKVIGSADVDHLDTASGYATVGSALTRQFSRTLFNVKAASTFDEAVAIHPDVATAMPTTANRGLSADHRTYTIKLRSGVLWNTPTPREVTAEDFVRGIKRLCNPASPSGALAYYTSTIQGMQTFCTGFAKVGADNARAIADYQNRTRVSGLVAKDDKTLVIRLVQPANDFTNILALPFAAAAPREYDAYVPDSPEFRRHTISDGPYQITSYLPNKQYVLEKNQNWRQDADPLRAQNVQRIRITLGQDSPDSVQQQILRGTADLSWDQPVPRSNLPRLRSNPNFKIMDGSTNTPYLVFNTLSPNNGRALADREVRRAILYAIDKATLIRLYGGSDVGQLLHQVIPPGSIGHQRFDLYPTPGGAGDAAMCKRKLAAAGHPGGLRLIFPYRINSFQPQVAQSIQANLKACGITAQLYPDTTGNLYGRTLVTPEETKAGKWDIATPGWVPDWYGNNGRATVVPLFDGRHYGPNSANYGGYNNDKVNVLIDEALKSTSPAQAARLWTRVDKLIMEDVAVVPLMNKKHPILHSARVRNALYLPTSQSFDFNQVRLSSS
ncbi:ABC transporter substrate-binding protein [Actinomadura alba]